MPPPRAARADLPLSPAVRAIMGSHRLAGLSEPQRAVYALLVQTLTAYRGDWLFLAVAAFFSPFIALLGVALALAVMAGGGWLISLVAPGADSPAALLLYAVPMIVVVSARVLYAQAHEGRVELWERDDGSIAGFHLGRLHETFHVTSWVTTGFFLGCAFGFQWGLLAFAADHGGLPIDGGVGETFWLTVDNLCHGIFLDTFELYDLHLGAKPAHTWQSATVFYAFRLAFDALALLIAYGAYQRYRIRRLFWWLPADPTRLDDWLGWLDDRGHDPHRWPARYFDEFLFLLLAKEYLRGNVDFVRHLSRQFPWLAVARPVRDLFRGPDGAAVLLGRYDTT